MLIYQLVFGTDGGQVCCAFHNEDRPSAGISSSGQYNCFVCGAKAHNEIGFIAKYFGVGLTRAAAIKGSLDRLQGYKYTELPLTPEQIKYFMDLKITEEVMNKYFFSSGVGKLMYKHTWNGLPVGYTWFNAKELSTYNAGTGKYKYDGNVIAGMLSPYDDVIRYNNLLVCEGEKDMLIAKSMGIPNAVAKIGGAKTYIIGGRNIENKEIVLCYDCDEFGRDGALQDARILIERFACKVKIIDLGLKDKEDLHDYFVKYGKTLKDFRLLIKNTPLYIPSAITTDTKMEKILRNLSEIEKEELTKLLLKENESNE